MSNARCSGVLLGVHEVHRDLRLAVDLEAQSPSRSAARRTSRAPPSRPPSRPEGWTPGRGTRCRRRGMDARRSRPRRRSGGRSTGRSRACAAALRADLLAQPLELAAADVGEVLAVGARGGALVQEDGDLELAPDALAELARERDAVLHRRSLERDEGHDVGGAHARVLAGVRGEVDVSLRLADAGERRVGDRASTGATKVMTCGCATASERDVEHERRRRRRRSRRGSRRSTSGRRPSEKFGNALDELHADRQGGMRSVERARRAWSGLPQHESRSVGRPGDGLARRGR